MWECELTDKEPILQRLPRELRDEIERAGLDPAAIEANFQVFTRISDHLYKKKVLYTDIAPCKYSITL